MSKSIFSKTQSIEDFILIKGGSTMELLETKGGTVFFAMPGTDITGRVAKDVEALDASLSVSWFAPEPSDEYPNATPSFLVHRTGEGGAKLLDTLRATPKV